MSTSPRSPMTALGGCRRAWVVAILLVAGVNCPAADIVLPSGTITTTVSYGPAGQISSATPTPTIVGTTGNLTCLAGRVVLNPGFAVQAGGVLHIVINAAPTISDHCCPARSLEMTTGYRHEGLRELPFRTETVNSQAFSRNTSGSEPARSARG